MYEDSNFPGIKMLQPNDFNSKFELIHPSLKNAKVIVLFYRDTCPHCVDFKPEYKAAALADRSGVIYTAVDTGNSAHSDFMNKVYEDPAVPFIMEGVPTVVSYNYGVFYSMYGPGDNEPEFRSKDGVMYYGSGIGTAQITMRKN